MYNLLGLILYCIIFLRFFYTFVGCCSSFVLIAVLYSYMRIYHTLLVHSPVDRHFECFYVFGILNNLPMNIFVYVLCYMCPKFSLGYIPRSQTVET